MFQYTVFVSHSSADLELVQAIQDAARPLGITTYMYEQDLQPGITSLPTKLIDRIRTSDAVVAILTEAAAQSPAVNQEIGAAKAAGKPVVALLEANVDWNQFTLLQGTEYLEFDRANPSDALVALTGRLGRMKSENDTRGWIVLLIIAAVAIWATRSA